MKNIFGSQNFHPYTMLGWKLFTQYKNFLSYLFRVVVEFSYPTHLKSLENMTKSKSFHIIVSRSSVPDLEFWAPSVQVQR